MFWNLLRLEATKVFRPALLWIGLGGLAGLSGIFFTLFFAFRSNVPLAGRENLYWPVSLVYGLAQATGFSPETSFGVLLTMIVVGVVTAREYSWRTWQLWLGHGVSRPAIVAAKLVAALAPAAVILLTCLVAIGGLSVVFSLVDHGSVDVSRVDPVQLALGFGRTLYAMLPYAALAFLLAVVSRSAVVAVGGGIGFVMVLETTFTNVLPLLGSGFARAVQYLPAGLSNALNAQDAALAHTAPTHGPFQPDPAVAAAGIAAYTLLFCGLALMAFRRQDLSS
jgi:ABC-type transport system involved in multi-copper enzyme maturation permease subunit